MKEARAEKLPSLLEDARVAAAALSAYDSNLVEESLARVTTELGWSDDRGPFGKVIPARARVLVKPNLVLHENQGPWGMEPVVTNLALIRVVVEAALRAGAAEVLVGDAPLQGCDFERLLRVTGMAEWAAQLMQREPRFKGIRDFRRTTCVFVNGVRQASEGLQTEDHFTLFDLGANSLLEPITNDRAPFRVTCYDPRLLARTHAPGRHQYLVAREIVEANVVINLPKLKTHKKAGITNALKNLIGINGNKEYLPHHRVGGTTADGSGGDCYPKRNPLKRAIEYASDREYMTPSFSAARAWHSVGKQFDRAARLLGDQLGVEGSWSGNDTIWRTCLDLNRILLYGRADGTMSDEPQRQILHVVDAVVAGQGDGPLAPEPLPLGLLLAGQNAAAVDWVGAFLLGYEPERVPLTREAFGNFPWPLTTFPAIEVRFLRGWRKHEKAFEAGGLTLPVKHPIGWRDAARSASREDETIYAEEVEASDFG